MLTQIVTAKPVTYKRKIDQVRVKHALKNARLSSVGNALTLLQAIERHHRAQRPPLNSNIQVSDLLHLGYRKGDLGSAIGVLNSIHPHILDNQHDIETVKHRGVLRALKGTSRFEIRQGTLFISLNYPVRDAHKSLERIYVSKKHMLEMSMVVKLILDQSGLYLKEHSNFHYPIAGKRRKLIELLVDKGTVIDTYDLIDSLADEERVTYPVHKEIGEINRLCAAKLELPTDLIESSKSIRSYFIDHKKYSIEKVA